MNCKNYYHLINNRFLLNLLNCVVIPILLYFLLFIYFLNNNNDYNTLFFIKHPSLQVTKICKTSRYIPKIIITILGTANSLLLLMPIHC